MPVAASSGGPREPEVAEVNRTNSQAGYATHAHGSVCVLRLFYSINLMYLLNARGCLEWGATRTRGGGSKQNKLSRRVCNVCLWQCACMLRLFYSINLMYLLNARGSMLMFGKHRSANICFDVSQGSTWVNT